MLRLSDRLTSVPPTPTESRLDITGDKNTSDGKSNGSVLAAEQEYAALVDLIGLLQTVKILESEYSLLSEGKGIPPKNKYFNLGYWLSMMSF
jgi:hypothetical protein